MTEETTVESEPTFEPLRFPADGLTDLIDSDQKLAEACQILRSHDGPIAIDAERASSYKYSARAYLIQLRRQGAGTFLIDPLAISDFSELSQVMQEAEWILHAATQDLACLAELSLVPSKLFDTEHAGRLLGRERVGLQGLLETEMNLSLAKEYSAADWSTRPLPEPWLTYAALDVEKLIELREILLEDLKAKDRVHWAEQDFASLLKWKPAAALPEPWRKTSGIHQVRQPKQLAVIRALWIERDLLAKEKDKAVSKVLPDAAMIDIAKHELKSAKDLYKLDSLRNRSHKALADYWWEVRQNALSLSDSELPKVNSGFNSIPPTKAWEEKNPDAHERFTKVRPMVLDVAQAYAVAPEIIVSPEVIRKLCWQAYENLEEQAALDEWLEAQNVRQWQSELISTEINKLLFS